MIAQRYSGIAIILHWMIAVAIICQLGLGLYMTRLGDSQIERKFWLFQFHKSVGMTVLGLSLVRLFWRLVHRPPAPPMGQPKWEHIVARLLHLGFYVFMIGMPITGWIIVSTSPFNIPTVLFGVIPWPDLPIIGGLADKALISTDATSVHAISGYIMIGAVGLHIAAALKHQVVNKDEVLWRMLPLPFLGSKRRIQ
jgi:cytochrome b561